MCSVFLSVCSRDCIRATPYRRKSTPPPILTRHLYHHTPLVEYILKHLYMYPRTRVFGSWDITQTYHRPYAHICMHMHSYGYTCVHMHADARPLPHPRLTLHAYACMCIHMYPYACRCVHMHTHWRPTPCIPSICMHERASGCRCVQMDDSSNHSLCNSSLYGLYVMAFHRVPSEGGVLM